MWVNKKPDLKRMEIFGAEAYAKNLGYLKKIDMNSTCLWGILVQTISYMMKTNRR